MLAVIRKITGHETTDKWLAKQAIWRDSDMFKALLFGIAIGVAIGFLWGYSVGAPDLSGITHTGIIG
jgi:hypothetical protein